MKNIVKYNKIVAAFMLGLVVCIGFSACEEYPDAYKGTGGVPEVIYVRIPNVNSADSLIDGALLGSTVCLVGNNMRSVKELYFNDQKAILNISYITDNTLIAVLPKEIPEVVTDNLYLISTGGETVSFPFKSKVPSPSVNAISCEYAEDGDVAVLYGDFFIDDPNVPLKISMAGNIPVTEIVDIQKTQITFRVPEGSQRGYINVDNIYGTGRSKFQFRDNRGMILDWDNLTASGGWRSGNLSDVDGISGNYVVFKGTVNDAGDWSEDEFSFNLWGTSNRRPEGDLFDATNLDGHVFKFEVNVRNPWTVMAMQIVFTPWGTSGTNSYYGDAGVSRGLWIPWADAGSYQTDGWVTVTIPMSDFKYNSTGGLIDQLGAGNYGGLSMFIWNSGGIVGTAPCNIEMWIDNIRVVPAE